MMEIQLRGSRMKIQNTKDYGLSGKVDYVKYIFYAATILNVIQQINKNKEVYTLTLEQ